MVEGSDAPTDGLVVLVVDDEAPARNELAWVLDQDPRVSRVLAAPSGTAALAALEHERIDVVFSDISMPGLDGMQLARVIKRFSEPPAVVFVTAHDNHAVDAFDLDAVDYVMKPVRQERIGEAVRRCLVDLERGERATPEEDETIPVELGGVTRFVSRHDIRYVQAHGDYARLHTARGSHLVRIPLATLEERWQEAGFVRIHRSTIVSTRHITEVRMDQGRCTVVVDGDVMLQVSRRHTRALRSTLLRLGDKT
ncbi:response regulator transcription factor [Janibacter sp. YIM B02568]|jgi:DNA-binding LytR/AlgR family response regulator|uniref:LytR/AlgR family response regulator transcription factor n=1 Tax=Janibacter endophyticus TaxID=2806261 RepID=UPI001951800E|nr:LytTR family DNA-binding domain-containing protein [Janibacter endophyticus]MBM6547213.1 response regulator transcription factor [Janibacter endophyticus]